MASRVVFVAALVACAWFPASAEATFPGVNGKFAFGDPNGHIETENPDGTDFIQLPNDPPFVDQKPVWSADGTKIAFERAAAQSASQPESAIGVMNADGSGQTLLTAMSSVNLDHSPTWSPDGQRLAFARTIAPAGCDEVEVMNADGTNLTPVLAANLGPCGKGGLSWSPLGDKIAFAGQGGRPQGIYTVNADGTGLTHVTDADQLNGGVDWSPAGDRLIFGAFQPDGGGDRITIVSEDGVTTYRIAPSFATQYSPVWSPDGTRIGYAKGGLATVDDAGGDFMQLPSHNSNFINNVSWQPVPPPPPPPPGYPRPRGASPTIVDLVPAYRACTDPNSAHGAPLSFGSCAPPQQMSDSLTVGTPDSNGARANSIGQVGFKVIAGDPSTAANEADVAVTANITDVRCRQDLPGCQGGALSDYAGSLQLFTDIRITDTFNGGLSRDPATARDWIQFFVPIQCTATLDTTIGSTCAAQTTLNALMPGAIREGNRAIWQLGQIGVRDGGIDDPRVDAYTTFMVEGLFVP